MNESTELKLEMHLALWDLQKRVDDQQRMIESLTDRMRKMQRLMSNTVDEYLDLFTNDNGIDN